MSTLRAPRGASLTGMPSWLSRGVPRFLADPFLLYTATLIPVVIAVAIAARRPGELPVAIGISAAAIAAQALLGRWMPRALRRRRRIASLVRVAVPLAYVGASVQLIGGPALPLLALYAPVVAGAAALGPVQGWTVAAAAAATYLLPEVGPFGASSSSSPAAVALRGITLAGVALILAYGTRGIVRALERAAREARSAAARERRRRGQIEALEAVGRVLAVGGPSGEVIDSVTDLVATRFGYAHCSVYLGDEHQVRLVAQRGYTDAAEAFDNSAGVAGRVMRTRQLAFVPDVAADPDYVPGTLPAVSLICAPLVLDGRFFGLFSVESTGAPLDATDRSLVAIMATRIGTAVALGHDRQALAARADLFRDIDRFARDVSGSLAIDPLARVIVEAVGRVVPADVVAITLLDRSDGRYRVRAVRGNPPGAVGREIGSGEGLAGRAIRDRTIVVDDTMTPDKLPTSVRDLAIPPLARGIAAPLVRDGVVVGALTVGRTALNAPFDDLELEGLQLVAAHAALAVANAFLHDEVQQLASRPAHRALQPPALRRGAGAAHRRPPPGAARRLAAARRGRLRPRPLRRLQQAARPPGR